jgi:isopenicillin N synthase-like dioxygenase
MLQDVDIDAPPVPSSASVLAALRDGFFLVRHNISDYLLDDAYGLLGEFFALDAGEKLRLRVPGTNGQSGYTPPFIETARVESRPDWKELFHWGRALPAGHPLRVRYPQRYPEPCFADDRLPNMRAVLTRLHEEMLNLQARVLTVIAVVVGLHERFLVDTIEDGPVVNRATWYPPMSLAPDAEYVWAGAHTDFDLITALPRATSAGLEVMRDGEWVGVTPPPGYAVINAGMVLERLTNGLIPAALHRVRSPAGAADGRLSIVQFCHPTPWTIINPITHITPATPIRFASIAADDLFTQAMYRINRLDSARALVPEAAG